MNTYIKIILVALFSLSLSACSSNPDKIKVETLLNNASQTWGGQDLPAYPQGNPRISLLKFTVAPNEALPRHFHSVINVAYMIKGELTVYDDEGNSMLVKAGSPLIELVGKVHYGKNTSNEVAELVVFYVNDDTEIPITTKTDD